MNNGFVMDFPNREKSFILSFFILMLAFMPSFFYVALSLPSLTIGLFFVISLELFFFLFLTKGLQYNRNLLVVSIVISSFFFVFDFIHIINEPVKVGGSIIIFFVLFIYCIVFVSYIDVIGFECFSNSIKYITKTIAISGWFGVFFKFNFMNYNQYVKSVFTFYEPSHFAIVFGVLLIPSLLLSSKYEKVFFLLSTVVFSFALPSLSMLVYLILYLVLTVNTLIKYVFYALVFLLIAYAGAEYLDLAGYFIDRLSFSDETTNLSALVYMQGWSEAYKSLIETNGFGLGLQMAGTNEPSLVAEKIYEIAGIYKNRADGGFLAAKLIIELGYIGLLINIIYLYLFFKSILILRNRELDISVISYGVVFSFSVEMYVRNPGYFSFGAVIMIISLFFLYSNKQSNSVDKC